MKMMKQAAYGLVCLGAGVVVSTAVPVGAVHPLVNIPAPVEKLSSQCKQRIIQNNLVVICPDAESNALRKILP
ncbi:hypothetical protein [Escherichia phage vB-EcoP-XT73]|uniref:Holin n=1 Tax=Escherichia phage vB-EcoP-XT18 TaxID=3093889 RepID=A0ABZ0S3Y1_9CAUD|nr:holin [Escherichia phage vB-EcoP-XT18]WPK41948.1 hypothetical protein [Escherichia phage vB-EcoP-XT32]WPK42099.1 hypothetical protein [Escherichia phage vB-EcoP-XT73]